MRNDLAPDTQTSSHAHSLRSFEAAEAQRKGRKLPHTEFTEPTESDNKTLSQ
jgi:hypothetical protein